MNAKTAVIFILLVTLLTACNVTFSPPATEAPAISALLPTSLPAATSNPPTPIESVPIPIVIKPAEAPLFPQLAVLNRAFDVLAALKDQDFGTLSSLVHPVDGVRFSPYTFIQDTDQVFSAEQIATIPADSQVYLWGEQAGSGEPINLSFMDYYARFIYDVDFVTAPEISLNHILGLGSAIDNSAEVYPGAMIVEFYFPSFDAQYGGMDWRSLRLVFTEYENSWYLVGVIHGEWTP
jgi:hypothetical protein